MINPEQHGGWSFWRRNEKRQWEQWGACVGPDLNLEFAFGRPLTPLESADLESHGWTILES